MMKKIRDLLIVLVLGGVAVYVVVNWMEHMQAHSVAMNVVVRDASLACIDDGMKPCDFSSVESAQKYLDCHTKLVNKRSEMVAKTLKQRQGECKKSVAAGCEDMIKWEAELDAKLAASIELTTCFNDLETQK